MRHSLALTAPSPAPSGSGRAPCVMPVEQHFFSGERGAHKVQIDRIAAQHVGLLQGALRLRGQKLRAARGQGPRRKQCYGSASFQLQSGANGLAASASVTPPPACLGTCSGPPAAQTAARSQTLSTPVTLRTKAEGVKWPSTALQLPGRIKSDGPAVGGTECRQAGLVLF